MSWDIGAGQRRKLVGHKSLDGLCIEAHVYPLVLFIVLLPPASGLPLMRFAPVNPRIGAAKRAYPSLDLLHQPESGAGLALAGVAADRAVPANVG